MFALPDPTTEVPTRTEIPKPSNYTQDKKKTLLIIFPRLTEYLNRKEILKYEQIHEYIYTNIIIWLKKRNRYQILKGNFDEELLDICEEKVKQIEYSGKILDEGFLISTL